ncbi:uncharacterized protein PITG_05747 [Phytophthora infestans T30-4]|uniref:LRRNT domain-containing protein n=2 Tax=Phytophthora infestans TaxID=4787 RepID=D0N5L1_PHYIT|nr:uncharacterized protein PITG_05747 [Phytophthora infestans T30-4]EEY70352.1 conserved hypothetical protein [Phytophthora infestans T30-4]KAF4044737.1 Leucine-rich repeat domain-containing protein [Phytophthora infestans]KAF4140104.1 Leucine rich repeat domain-containing protein [Phytophthora infestans]|eukprot:XP_002998006.1 conserved hypothetical protein [Phytophthora infestans T30-4]
MWRCELLVLLSFHTISGLLPVEACPTECHCIGQARVSVYCDFRGLKEVPINIPVTTTYLDLSGNKFTKVLPEMFLGYVTDSEGVFTAHRAPLTQLKVIHLDLNPVRVVNEHAFDTTPSLELIYLPFDVKIQRQAFAEMKTDKLTFDGYERVEHHPLEDPHFVAFSRSSK